MREFGRQGHTWDAKKKQWVKPSESLRDGPNQFVHAQIMALSDSEAGRAELRAAAQKTTNEMAEWEKKQNKKAK